MLESAPSMTFKKRFERVFGVFAALYLAAVGYAIWFAIRNAAGGPFAGFAAMTLTLPTSLVAFAALMGIGVPAHARATIVPFVIGLCALVNVGITYLLLKLAHRCRQLLRPSNLDPV